MQEDTFCSILKYRFNEVKAADAPLGRETEVVQYFWKQMR